MSKNFTLARRIFQKTLLLLLTAVKKLYIMTPSTSKFFTFMTEVKITIPVKDYACIAAYAALQGMKIDTLLLQGATYEGRPQAEEQKTETTHEP